MKNYNEEVWKGMFYWRPLQSGETPSLLSRSRGGRVFKVGWASRKELEDVERRAGNMIGTSVFDIVEVGLLLPTDTKEFLSTFPDDLISNIKLLGPWGRHFWIGENFQGDTEFPI